MRREGQLGAARSGEANVGKHCPGQRVWSDPCPAIHFPGLSRSAGRSTSLWAGAGNYVIFMQQAIAPAYRPRDAEHTVLHLVVAEHLEAFLGAVAEAADGAGLPRFVEHESPVLAGIVGVSVQGRVAPGQRAEARVGRLGDARDTPAVTSRGARQAHLEGFDLHANVWVSVDDRAAVERLSRYVLRPPIAQERLRLRSDGRIALEIKRAWHDGTRELVFEPLEFLERLAAMTPRPDTNLCPSAMACWPRTPAGARERSCTGAWRPSPGPRWRRGPQVQRARA